MNLDVVRIISHCHLVVDNYTMQIFIHNIVNLLTVVCGNKHMCDWMEIGGICGNGKQLKAHKHS
jgi:hypothetical protein